MAWFVPLIIAGAQAATSLWANKKKKEEEANATGVGPADWLAQITSESQKQGVDYGKQAWVDIGRRDELMRQPIEYYSALASGDRDRMTQAAAPILRSIADQYSQAKFDIMNQMPRGAAQQYALAQARMGAANASALALQQGQISAFDKLAGMGSQYGQWGFQSAGAAQSYLQDASRNAIFMTAMQQQQDEANKKLWLDIISQVGRSAMDYYNTRNTTQTSVTIPWAQDPNNPAAYRPAP